MSAPESRFGFGDRVLVEGHVDGALDADGDYQVSYTMADGDSEFAYVRAADVHPTPGQTAWTAVREGTGIRTLNPAGMRGGLYLDSLSTDDLRRQARTHERMAAQDRAVLALRDEEAAAPAPEATPTDARVELVMDALDDMRHADLEATARRVLAELDVHHASGSAS